MSNNVVRRIALGVLVVSMIPGPAYAQVSTEWEAAAARSGARYEFRTFEVCPGCLTGTGGINDRGFIGAALIAADESALQGYVYDSKADTATAIPGSVAATVPSTNGRTPGWGFGPGGFVPVIEERDGSATVLAGFPRAVITAILQFGRNGAARELEASEGLRVALLNEASYWVRAKIRDHKDMRCGVGRRARRG